MQPNLFVIGAMKCGTSSLHDYLSAHPQIVMSTVKEPGYFVATPRLWCREIHSRNGQEKPSLEGYLQLFRGAKSMAFVGESTTSYTKWPHYPGVAQRLHQFNPDARLVYIVRDPVERALSNYWFSLQKGWESGPPEVLQRNSRYWNFSNYAMQLRQYLPFFPREQIHVLTLEDLTAAPAATMGALFRWLGLDMPPGHSDARYSERKNATEELIRPQSRLLARWQQSTAAAIVRRMLPPPMRLMTRELIAGRDVSRTRVDMSVQIEFLRELLIPCALEFEELCGRQFRQWRTLWGAGLTAGRQDLTAFQPAAMSPNGADLVPGVPAN